MVNDQSPSEPKSIVASSTTYSDHVPFGEPPSNVDKGTFPLGAGAGAGNGSPGS